MNAIRSNLTSSAYIVTPKLLMIWGWEGRKGKCSAAGPICQARNNRDFSSFESV